jgi:hypothetical protein
MRRRYLLSAVLLALSAGTSTIGVGASSKMYYYCETKTGEPEKWFFSDFFQADPYDSSKIAVDFTKFVRNRYSTSTQHAIGPGDCYYRQSRTDVEDSRRRQAEWATSQGNSVVETGWAPSQ